MNRVAIPLHKRRLFALPDFFLRVTSAGRRALLCLSLIFVLAGILDSFVAYTESRTVDEPDYISYGVQILKGTPDRSANLLWNSKTPASALNALPRTVAQFVQPHSFFGRPAQILSSVFAARLPSVLSLLLLCVFVYFWARELYGITAALTCSVMAVLSPNLIAHGTLATADGYFALAVISSLYFFRRYLLQPTLRNAAVSAFILALAQLAKPFSFYLYGVVIVFLIFRFVRAPANRSQLTGKEIVIYLVLLAVCFIAVVNIGYSFRGTLTSLGNYHFQSFSFQRIQALPFASAMPVPLPSAYLQGLDLMKHCDDAGLTYGNLYLLGELRPIHGANFEPFKSYYIVAWLLKEPIALQILFVLGLFALRKRSWDELVLGEGLLLFAGGTLVVWQSFFRNSQIGIRNILPALAVEVIIAGGVFASFSEFSKRRKAVLLSLLGWLAISTFSYYPHMIPYMNEWVINRKMSYKYLADSNLDWGQNRALVNKFLQDNPDVKLNPPTQTAGRVLVSINHLVGLYPHVPPMSWLLSSRPVAHVGYAHLLYVIPDHQARRMPETAR